MSKRKLTPKQAQFCKEYPIDFNGSKAAIRAGYVENSARITASKLLTNPNIHAQLQKEIEKRSKRTEITSDSVLQELAKIAFFDIRGLFNDDWTMKQPSEWSDDVAAVIGGIEVNHIVGNDDLKAIVSKLKLSNKEKSLELIGRHLAMFTDRNVNINYDREEFKGKDPEKYLSDRLSKT